MHAILSLARDLARDLADLVAPPVCAACGAAFPPSPPLCALCRGHLAPPDDPPPGVAVSFDHGGPLARAIHRAKYGRDPGVAASLGALLAETWRAGAAVDVIVPVPLHPARLASRGFNQSVELSRALAKRLGAGMLYDGARRVRDTPSQVGRDREARRLNVEGAFAVSAGVRGARVLLIDDVVTTGATLGALRAACLDAGAESVGAAALARAPLFMSR